LDLLQHMRTFVRIADSGSISQAARSLRLSVAMTSRHLRALEQHVGAELVRRTTRRLTLTEPGAAFLLRSRALLASAAEARDSVRSRQEPAGLLVMSLPVSFGLAQIRPLFPALLEKYPRLQLDLRFEDRFIDLLTDGVDLAIRAGVAPPDSPFIIARKLATVERVLCAAPALLARHGRVPSLDALPSFPCVVQGASPARWSFEAPTGPKLILVDGRLRTNNVFAIREAAIEGLGIARLPRWIVDEDLKRRRLVVVLPEAVMPRIDVLGMFHRGSRDSAAIQAAIAFLQAELPRRTKMQSI
jgi:DNA-binding transcriptional LysR family regulator